MQLGCIILLILYKRSEVLKNRQHEKIARNLIHAKGNKPKAYQLTYPKANTGTCKSRGYAIIKKYPEIMERTAELLTMQGAPKAVLNERLIELTESKNEAIALSSLNTAYKLHGELQSAGVSVNIDQRSVNIEKGGLSDVKLEGLTRTLKQIQDMNQRLGLSKDKLGKVDGNIIDV